MSLSAGGKGERDTKGERGSEKKKEEEKREREGGREGECVFGSVPQVSLPIVNPGRQSETDPSPVAHL